ncbi:DUF1641 domain-containing protein [Mycolicibacterium sp. 120270]|uniref:DUF1641 domain-containing protein n=1 Tax=Mycolicibacterium sp. 120270 TaxID=3090600 RepID=UPI00299F1CAD|nr:DUF1641 domain-containing protein [Mycolicibacterium sp. 120270]MDX1882161.1 DUF1641 domain-containing protein [Mycolicibacterium sp. 120270]
MAADGSLMATLGSDELIDESPGDDLIARLDDPKIASSISLILDHADLLATIIVGLDGMMRRADVIGDSLASSIAEIRDVASNGAQREWPSVDVASVGETITRLSAAAADAMPAIERLLHSPLTDVGTADVLADLGEALRDGRQAAAADPRGPKGIFALMRVTKDPDVSRGLGFMIHIARAFGQRLAVPAAPANGGNGRHAAT